MPTADHPHLIQFNLKLDGSDAPADLHDVIVEIQIENSLHLPDACTIRVIDHDFQWLDAETFKPGTDVKVMSGYETTTDDGAMNVDPIFAGEVTSVEVDMDAGSAVILSVHCLDRSHRLHRGRKTKTFQNVTDTDIVNQVAPASGLTVDADSTSTVHDWVMQNNQTDYEFLNERAKRAGFRLWVEGQSKLRFKKVQDDPLTTNSDDSGGGEDEMGDDDSDSNSGGSTVKLEWGKNLLSFRPHLTAGPQVDKVQVRGWDRKQKQEIVSDNSSTPLGLPQVGTNNNGGSVASSAFSGSATMVVTDHPIFSQSEADSLAQSVRDELGGDYLQADGTCTGNPDLKPGVAVNIANIGQKYSGKYVLSSTTHVMSHGADYKTHFTISGKRPASLLSALSDDHGSRSKMGGNIVVGIVTQNKDDGDHGQGIGRVKVKYPWLGDNQESDWAQIAVPMAGGGRGFFFLPEINDEVLVAFEHGDVRRPYVIGALWNGVDNPMKKNADVLSSDNKVDRRIIQTRIGHMLVFDDSDDKAQVQFTTHYGHTLNLDDKNKKIEAKTTSGHTVTLDDQNSKIVIVDKTSGNKITINSNDNSISCECTGDFKVTAQGKVSVTGQQGIEMNTPMQFKASASAGMNLSTDAQMQLQAQAEMQITASGPTSIKGAIVQIN